MRTRRRATAPALAATLALALTALLGAAPAQASFPGKPGPIAYTRVSVGETADLFLGGLFAHGPAPGDAAEQLTDDAWDRSPSYSADGRLVAFESKRRAPGERRGIHIFVMRSDGTEIRQLTHGDQFSDSNPSFSPDGRRIVFDRHLPREGDEPTHIFSIGVDGSGLRQLTRGEVEDSNPVYTPDGRRIVFVSNRGPQRATDIFAMRPNGRKLRRLLGGPRREFDPDVSPNGRRIAFAANYGPGRGPNVFTARMDGQGLRKLTDGDDSCFRGICFTDPVWSPSGRQIAYQRDGESGTAIEVIRADGRGSAKTLDRARTFEDGFGTSVLAPAWGPAPG